MSLENESELERYVAFSGQYNYNEYFFSIKHLCSINFNNKNPNLNYL